MQQILVYSDSLTWGIVPSTRERLSFDKRWPGVLENHINTDGQSVRIIENCLNGRRTVFDDPFKQGRNGLEGLEQVIEMHSPLALVILMLGTNDFQSMHTNNTWHAAQGIRSLITAIRRAPIEPGMLLPPILLVSPPLITEPKGPIAAKFSGTEERCVGLAEAYATVAKEMGVAFFDAESVTTSSRVDGIHLDEDQHFLLGQALAIKVKEILG